jgi:hypothetical protein
MPVGLCLLCFACSSGGGSESKQVASEASCPSGTGYAGDANCIAPPSEAEGFQLHFGPTDHDDPDEVAKYLLAPSEEIVKCYAEKTHNATDVYSVGYQFHMRPGSHHLIAQTQPTAIPDGFLDCGSVPLSAGGLGGTQTEEEDYLVDPAPENQGLAIQIPADEQAILNFHVINTTEKPILSEAWLNYFYAPQTEVHGYRGAVFLVGGLGFRIDPQTSKTYQYSCSPNKPTRVLTLAAHMHTHATRMTAWKVSGGVRTKVLEAFNWAEPGTVYFDSVHQNPTSDASAQRTGADISGDLVIQPTDELQWECAIDNTSAQTLTFRNEVQTGEMCVVTGTEVRDDDPMAQGGFGCVRN